MEGKQGREGRYGRKYGGPRERSHDQLSERGMKRRSTRRSNPGVSYAYLGSSLQIKPGLHPTLTRRMGRVSHRVRARAPAAAHAASRSLAAHEGGVVVGADGANDAVGSPCEVRRQAAFFARPTQARL